MGVFTDSGGREWRLGLTLGDVRRVRALAGVDLLRVDQIEKLARLMEGEIIALVDVLWAICEPQAKERGVSADAFADAVIGDPLAEAVDALIPELIRFFPDPRRRTALTKVFQTTREAMGIVAERAGTAAETLTAELLATQVLTAAGVTTPTAGPSSGSAPESSG